MRVSFNFVMIKRKIIFFVVVVVVVVFSGNAIRLPARVDCCHCDFKTKPL